MFNLCPNEQVVDGKTTQNALIRTSLTQGAALSSLSARWTEVGFVYPLPMVDKILVLFQSFNQFRIFPAHPFI